MNTGLPSIPLGRVRGIVVGAHWSTLVAVIVIAQVVAMSVLPQAAPGHATVVYWIAGVLSALAFMLSLLAHELAHALAAQRFGVGVDRIDLWLLGGVSRLSSSPRSPRAAFLIAVAGPATSVVVAVLAGAAGTGLASWGAPALISSPLLWLAITNGVLAVFNLVPAAPLDGGRVLAAAVWWRTGDEHRGTKTAALAGRAFGLALVAFGLMQVFAGALSGLWLVLLGAYLVVSSAAEQSANEMKHRLGGVRVRDVMIPDPPIAPGWWTVGTFLAGLATGPHRLVFPVVSFDGAVVGSVGLAELVRVPDPLNTRISDVCRAPSVETVTSPDEKLLDVLGKAPLRQGRDLVLVLRDEHLVGVIGPEDVAWALELSRSAPLTRHGVTS
ncbi:site-2 protease family protein [Lentzea aerocolonigenes]|uniref:site-2 protease family protein n=1 Tax=Lentzea aerocolonigenes TaxID=68170 RepID=UPI0004C43D61|nr:site-2 protease family protein [Lentzea aerocolonigenes]MCP2250441.1 Zn-dependent protease (includes SpoIVFB) [Lentzea aerocolonigenes]